MELDGACQWCVMCTSGPFRHVDSQDLSLHMDPQDHGTLHGIPQYSEENHPMRGSGSTPSCRMSTEMNLVKHAISFGGRSLYLAAEDAG